MARHNEVTLLGQVMLEPETRYDAEGNIVRVQCLLAVVRGIRDFGAVDKRLRVDLPIIMSWNKKRIEQLRSFKVGDMIYVKGTLATANTKRAVTCPICKTTQMVDKTIAYINPIFIEKRADELTNDEGTKYMKARAEISNHITILGKCCKAPEMYVTNKGQSITNFQLDVDRKYRIKEDDESNRHDFPFVKSYGKIAKNDYIGVKLDGEVFVDGALQTRDYPKKIHCTNPKCENYEGAFDSLDTQTEIVPYDTGYGRGCLTMAEIKAIKEEQQNAEDAANVREIMGDEGTETKGE